MMKQGTKNLISLFIGAVAAALSLAGCAGGSGSDAPAGSQAFPSPFPFQSSADTQTPAPQESLSPLPQESLSPVPQTPESSAAPTPVVGDAAAYVGTWVHTYEYFDVTYHTTLVIDGGGTAAYYNEEAELGNLSATWQLSEGCLVMNRSDGVASVLYVSGNSLIEQTYEDGGTYEAEYIRS